MKVYEKFLNSRLNLLGALIVFAYFLVFPFGQLLRFEFNLAGKIVPLLAIDLIASLSLLYFFLIKKPKVSNYFIPFFVACIFSLLISLNLYSPIKIFIGSMYLFRIFVYFSFFILIWNLTRNSSNFKDRLIYIFLISLIFCAFLGWMQYLFFFDLTYLKYAGWDDHLGRLTGTFLDPAFTGIILSTGFFVVFLKYLNEGKIGYFYLSLFFLMSLLLTYSRASYLAVVVGLVAVCYIKKKLKPIVMILMMFFLAIPFLPREKGEGVKLERTKSAILKIENYKKTINIIKNAPLFGVGFNNICWARETAYFDDISSHACSGADSSILFVFATTGIVGLFIFINLLKYAYTNTTYDYYGNLYKIFFIMILVHSLFSNSMFYPWLMGIGAMLLAVSTKE